METSAVRHIIILLLVLLVLRSSALGQKQIYNVLNFHAHGDGKRDDAQAFLAAWQAVCGDQRTAIMVVPAGRTFLLNQVSFQGPCKSPVTVQLDGNVVAPNHIWTRKSANLLTFLGVDDLTMDGNGEIDGQGAIWWDCYNRKVRRIHLKNSADKHMTLFQCSQVSVDNVSITAPADSPNTDGITVAFSNNTYISNCSIQTVLSFTKNVTVTTSRCGPGHGISFVGTMTGVRIKSWQGGKGYAKGFLFESLNMTEVQYPIVIDQFYCPQGNCPTKRRKFIDIQGTSSEHDAIRLLCSQSVHCKDIYLSNINLSWVNHTAPANATILNAHGTTEGIVLPRIQFSNTL
ncbi:hypothetical protein SETIT_5G122200v2 [Setaria italica]|uniref:Pectate lyase superfamily protein domain-containing protein n=1 Tax=Setaria italica TaxID=4555 RepID=A0A368R3W6_SETIT|nr:hypothetical protein SETIT_5G122200v2 [Setaria italica]